MRRALVAAAAIGLLGGGVASAKEPEIIAQHGNTKVVKEHRWAFNLAGKAIEPERVCPNSRVESREIKRTTNDLMYTIFTLGWYTPKTVTVRCVPSGNREGSAQLMSPTYF